MQTATHFLVDFELLFVFDSLNIFSTWFDYVELLQARFICVRDIVAASITITVSSCKIFFPKNTINSKNWNGNNL